MIQIDELQIRMAGNNKADGNELGLQVAERLGEIIPEHTGSHHITELNLQMQSTASNTTTQLADRIAERIIRQIKQKTL